MADSNGRGLPAPRAGQVANTGTSRLRQDSQYPTLHASSTPSLVTDMTCLDEVRAPGGGCKSETASIVTAPLLTS